MIEQHFYTRDRRGIFSKTPGYDTVAKSANLQDEFIINTLHDLCFYEAPASLAGEEDLSKYPKALFCVNTEEGSMVIGESAFVGRDYTGERNRYFTHNYIIPEEEKDDYIKNPERIIYSEGFINNYDINEGHVIPEVKEIRKAEFLSGNSSIEEMYSKASINEEIFVNIIKASFHAAQYGKKIYIVLDCDNNLIADISREILKYLYRVLPFKVRRKIGFITYMKAPKSKSLINIIFLCKGSIKRINTELKAGYIFDIPNKEFYIDGIDKEKHLFIDFAINNVENVQVLNDFFSKVDHNKLEESLNLRRYDDILNVDNERNSVKKPLNKNANKDEKKQHNSFKEYDKAQENRLVKIIKMLIYKIKAALKSS
ncbi:hypothetical protein HBE96_13450 [Clostridium sp. P21]|uniref:Uncharacterized protein n=1 Tax=Clostridium muellerianum TaxID=2716538 RepID=A0A7Y0HNY5_9CLOT|nr:hypothetical protein [Clostridium muellerianum]NMM63660.1 hypothetical protein [Clostridium muellerianum]